MSMPNFFVGLDVHKDTITIAVFRNRALTRWSVECELAAPVRFESHVSSCPISGSCPVSPTHDLELSEPPLRDLVPSRRQEAQDKRLRNVAHCHVNCTERVVATEVLALYGE